MAAIYTTESAYIFIGFLNREKRKEKQLSFIEPIKINFTRPRTAYFTA